MNLADRTAMKSKEKRNSLSSGHFSLRMNQAAHYVPGLGKKIWIYFSLMVLISLPLAVTLIYEVGSDRLHGQIRASIAAQQFDPDQGHSQIRDTTVILSGLQNRMVLALSVIFVIAIAGMFFLNRHVVKPLDEMGRAAFKMAHGHLDQVVPVRNRNEVGKIGEFINDLAIDLQEVLLHVWNHTRQDIVLLDRMAGLMNLQHGGNGLPPEIREDFYFVKRDIEDMRDMVKAFNYYHVRLEEERVLVNSRSQNEGEYDD